MQWSLKQCTETYGKKMSELLKKSLANILIYLLPEVCGLDGSVMNYTQSVLNQLHVWWPHPCSLVLAFCSMLLCFLSAQLHGFTLFYQKSTLIKWINISKDFYEEKSFKMKTVMIITQILVKKEKASCHTILRL